MRRTRIKGFRVKQDGRGKVTLERLPFYGMDRSAQIRARKSKKAKPIKQGVLGLHWKGGK